MTHTCDAGVVIGDPDRSAQLWVVRYSIDHSREIDRVGVLRAWQ